MMNRKLCGMKQSWHNSEVPSQNLPERTEKNTKSFSQDRWSPGRDLNPVPPEYEGVLTTRPRRSISLWFEFIHVGLLFTEDYQDDQIKADTDENVARMAEKRNVHNILVEKSDKSPLGRSRRRWKNNVNTNLRYRMWQYGLDSSASECGPSGAVGLFQTRQWTFGIQKIRRLYRPAKRLLASREEICTMEL
jgi:hypothetical protein